MIYVLLGVASIFAVLYIFVELTRKPLEAFAYKALASLSFIALAAFVVIDKVMIPSLYGWFLLGLVLGLIGDLILALRPLNKPEDDKTIINYGITFFGAGHIMYIIGTIVESAFYWQSLLIGSIMAGLIVLGSIVLKFQMGKSRIPSYLYAFLIFVMIGQTIMMGNIHGLQTGYLLLIIGAILFGISDLILAPIYFQGMNKKILIALNLVTYYGAQILIALSLFYL